MPDLTDIAFEDARDVGSITYRLHPLDVGFDLRGEGAAVEVDGSAPTLRASYASRDGERRVIEGPTGDVIRHLRQQGYTVVEVRRG